MGPRDTGEDKPDTGLSSWSIEPMSDTDPGHGNSRVLARKSREDFSEKVACTWDEKPDD